ncbi:MAG TPA: Holliday junction branch migration protein RuvA [Acidimicrobiales bacterium]|nr:Holliday junction branch migration protein RuvA [Acidimicrobiales bacterium]
MIGSLRGTVADRSPRGELVVEVGGVGYRLQVPASTMAAVGSSTGPVFLHVHTHVREDAIVLYGFATGEERDCFEALIGAHGVGPAVALAVLSTHTPTSLHRAVVDEDVDALMLVPGIGRKTAARLLIDLKGRLDGLGDVLSAAGPPSPAALNGARAEVQAALAGLGYTAEEVRQALRDVEDESPEEMLRRALRQMAAAR